MSNWSVPVPARSWARMRWSRYESNVPAWNRTVSLPCSSAAGVQVHRMPPHQMSPSRSSQTVVRPGWSAARVRAASAPEGRGILAESDPGLPM